LVENSRRGSYEFDGDRIIESKLDDFSMLQGINVLPIARSPAEVEKLRTETIKQSKQGMIASISKTFGKAFETKSTQMLIKLKTDQARKNF
jgi:hypothetical protein